MEDLFDRGTELVIGIFLLGFVALIVGICVDMVQGIRAEPKEYACEAKRMSHRRVTFTTDVVCVPSYRDTKADTLTVEVR